MHLMEKRIFSLLFAIVLFYSCLEPTNLIDLSVDLKQKFLQFQYRIQQVKNDLIKAEQDILIVSRANFKAPETKQFILDARERIKNVYNLEMEFRDLVKDTDFYFAYAYRKANLTSDDDLRKRYIQFIDKRKQEIVNLYKQINGTLLELQSLATKLNDILNGLEIAGAMSIVAQKEEEIQTLHRKMMEEISKLDSMIQKGFRLLDIELGE